MCAELLKNFWQADDSDAEMWVLVFGYVWRIPGAKSAESARRESGGSGELIMGACREIEEIRELLKKHGAVLERTKKHKIWRFPDGRIHVLPSTPSCAAAWKNQLHDLRKFLGEVDPDRGKPGERRAKKLKSKRSPMKFAASTSDVAFKDWKSTLTIIREQLGGGTAEAASELSSPPIGVDLPELPAPFGAPSEGLRKNPSTRWKFWTWKIWSRA